MTEITARPGEARVLPGQDAGQPTVSLDQLTALFHAAAEVERARRPIVLHGPDSGAAAPAAHPGVDLTIPGLSSAPLAAAAPGHRCGRFTEAQALLLCGVAGSAVGLLDTALTGSRMALLVALATTVVTALAALATLVEIRVAASAGTTKGGRSR